MAVLTGAGISAESGVPTFRGEGGLWRQFRAVDLATPEAFSRDPKLVWEFYNWRRELIAPLSPNPGHLALAEIERPRPAIYTDNSKYRRAAQKGREPEHYRTARQPVEGAVHQMRNGYRGPEDTSSRTAGVQILRLSSAAPRGLVWRDAGATGARCGL